jgi:DNA-binding IscR family transcriptional regulator
MNILEAGRRAIRICLCIAQRHEARIAFHYKTIADDVTGHPQEVYKLCESLVKAGYLVRSPDSAKSYLLALNPEQILLGDIVRIAEPDFHITDCSRAKQCPVNMHCYNDKKLWGQLENQMFLWLNQINLQNYLDNMYEVAHVAPSNCQLSKLAEE